MKFILFCLLFFAPTILGMTNISSLFTPNSSFYFYFSLEPVDIKDKDIKVVDPFQESLLAAVLSVKYTPCLKLVRNFRIYTLNMSLLDTNISELNYTELSFRIPILFKMQLDIYNFFSEIFYK